MWYDLFSLVYDRSLEKLYEPYRGTVVASLQLSKGQSVLDLPCGTGQAFRPLVEAVGEEGQVVGVDASLGMLRSARRRAHREEWNNVRLVHGDINCLDDIEPVDSFEASSFDGVHCALGLTAIQDWEQAFDTMFSLLRPGGSFVLFDVFAAARTRETRSVEFVARADLSRQVWRPLESRSVGFDRRVLPAEPKKFGGELYVACGRKPG